MTLLESSCFVLKTQQSGSMLLKWLTVKILCLRTAWRSQNSRRAGFPFLKSPLEYLFVRCGKLLQSHNHKLGPLYCGRAVRPTCPSLREPSWQGIYTIFIQFSPNHKHEYYLFPSILPPEMEISHLLSPFFSSRRKNWIFSPYFRTLLCFFILEKRCSR